MTIREATRLLTAKGYPVGWFDRRPGASRDLRYAACVLDRGYYVLAIEATVQAAYDRMLEHLNTLVLQAAKLFQQSLRALQGLGAPLHPFAVDPDPDHPQPLGLIEGGFRFPVGLGALAAFSRRFRCVVHRPHLAAVRIQDRGRGGESVGRER